MVNNAIDCIGAQGRNELCLCIYRKDDVRVYYPQDWQFKRVANYVWHKANDDTNRSVWFRPSLTDLGWTVSFLDRNRPARDETIPQEALGL